MLELVIVMAIIAIMMSFMVLSFRGSKRSGAFKLGSAAALSYADAIEAYMADNGQVPPAVGSAAWPSAQQGPINRMLTGPGGGKPYMKSVPESVSDGRVGFNTAPAAGGSGAQITYRITGQQYELLVETTGSDEVLRCVVSNAATTPSGVERCG